MLTDLPPEILAQIVSHAPTARFLRSLALTSRSLNELVKIEGWKTFSLTQFPSFSTPPCWNDAAHALATLSRSFDRRALLGRLFAPHNSPIHTLPDGKTKDRWQGPQGQTMGYQPVLDSYDEWTGAQWDDRREVVAWGAGAELVVKIVDWGGNVLEPKDRRASLKRPKYGCTRTKFEWLTYREPQHAEGRDDITTLKLLRPDQHSGATGSREGELAVVGRASGDLKLLRLRKGHTNCIVQEYETRAAPMRSADVTIGSSPLILACLGDSRAALYQVDNQSLKASPVSEVSCTSESERSCRTWTTRFLSKTTVAIGRGVTKHPVHVYQIAPDGITGDPIRVFGSGKGLAEGSATSVYPIVKIPRSSSSRDSDSHEFFSGGYDGKIRLHDMRSPSNCEAIIEDPTEYSAIFSLLMVGRERLLAGAAANSLLKVFDLRMMGGRTYSYVNLDDATRQRPLPSSPLPAPAKYQHNIGVEPRDPIYDSGWNVFLGGPGLRNGRSNHRSGESPVYSLSAPSSFSPNIYAGVENDVVHLNFTSMLDEHPDPLFRRSLHGSKRDGLNVGKTWDPTRRAANLSMYEQSATGDLPLRNQRPVGPLAVGAEVIDGLDERWCYPPQYRNLSRWPRNGT